MSLQILAPGLQATIQAAPRLGHRRLAVPPGGPADPLALQFANRLVGNNLLEPAIEVTLGGFSAVFTEPTFFAVTGAEHECTLNDRTLPLGITTKARAGDVVRIEGGPGGMRTYLSVVGGFQAEEAFGSRSTYLPSGFGGFAGRALAADDIVPYTSHESDIPIETVPTDLFLRYHRHAILRVVRSVEYDRIRTPSELFSHTFRAARQIDRIGIRLQGHTPQLAPSKSPLKSGAVSPGIIQCPEGGQPIILGPDAGTTGGYPRILAVTAVDLHRLGQIRPGDEIQLIERTVDEAIDDLRQRQAHLATWLDR
ncbi:MAG: biotin-dependent carboxyltransferase family protein [Pseudomonadota bacterium]